MPANRRFLSLNGSQALSQFRQQRLLSSLSEQGVELTQIQAQFVHFVWSDAELSGDHQKVLAGLLNYGEPFNLIEAKGLFAGKQGHIGFRNLVATKNDQSFNYISEFADVSGPIVFL